MKEKEKNIHGVFRNLFFFSPPSFFSPLPVFKEHWIWYYKWLKLPIVTGLKPKQVCFFIRYVCSYFVLSNRKIRGQIWLIIFLFCTFRLSIRSIVERMLNADCRERDRLSTCPHKWILTRYCTAQAISLFKEEKDSSWFLSTAYCKTGRRFLFLPGSLYSLVFIQEILGCVSVVCILLSWIMNYFSGLNIWIRLKTWSVTNKYPTTNVLPHVVQITLFPASLITVLN